METKTRQPLVTAIRWMRQSDFPSVEEIEKQCFASPLGESELGAMMRAKNNIAVVAITDGGRVCGHLFYELWPKCIQIVSLAVHEDARYKGVGRNLVNYLTSKLRANNRPAVQIWVRESDLDAQLFLKAVGFRCFWITRGFYAATGEAAYSFEFSILNH